MPLRTCSNGETIDLSKLGFEHGYCKKKEERKKDHQISQSQWFHDHRYRLVMKIIEEPL